MVLDGRRVVVTGGASGMGASAVRAFVREGAAVAVLDVQDERGTGVAVAADAEGPGRAVCHHCDVRSRAATEVAFAAAAADLGGLNGLVQCAGVDRVAPAESICEQDWDLVVGINSREPS